MNFPRLLVFLKIFRNICSKPCMAAAIVFMPAFQCAAGEKPASYSPYLNDTHPTHVYWGDTHLHTSYSIDANLMGTTRLGPDDAFRFAEGHVVTATNGMKVRLRRPLDFLVVTDHGEYLGLMPKIDEADPALMKTAVGRRWHEMRKAGKAREVFQELFRNYLSQNGHGKKMFVGKEFFHSVWKEYTHVADRNNEPGKFTAFIGYEWTSTPQGNNLHRNIIYEDDSARADKLLPFTSINSKRPEDLWKFLARYERKTGGHVLAIPHNPNLSGGLMFRPEDSDGKPFTRQYATTRARWEPLLEITQIKGNSETNSISSPDDEFADFGTWTINLSTNPNTTFHHQDWMYQYEYARPALKLGLKLQAKLGVNPFKLGFVGGTDSHTALSTVDEANYWGSFAFGEPHAGRYKEPWDGPLPGSKLVKAYKTWRELPGGYAAVWAMANTRKAIFEAMQRKETYATTGTRIIVRFFGGWDYKPADAASPDLPKIGYSEGVPMGGDLTEAPKGRAPTFLIRAVKDPVGANLDRAQVIKGWLDEHGKLHEKVYDVAVSGNRTIGPDGTCHQKVGDTVDIANASYSNTIGTPELAVVWTDPRFDPKQRAFYYLRVLEIPTPRWPAYDAKFYHEKLPKTVWAEAQQRAYTSPIWYTPAK